MKAKWKYSLVDDFQRSEGVGTNTKSQCFDYILYVVAKGISEKSTALDPVQRPMNLKH